MYVLTSNFAAPNQKQNNGLTVYKTHLVASGWRGNPDLTPLATFLTTRLGLKALAEMETVAANATNVKALLTFVMVSSLFLTLQPCEEREASIKPQKAEVANWSFDSVVVCSICTLPFRCRSNQPRKEDHVRVPLRTYFPVSTKKEESVGKSLRED